MIKKIWASLDFRWMALAFQVSVISTALFLQILRLPAAGIIGLVVATVLIDGLLKFGLHRYTSGSFSDYKLTLPLSSVSLASSVIFNIRAELEFVAIVAMIAIFSKYVFHFRGKHFFNPSNFGIVTALLFFSNDVVSTGSRWGTSIVFQLLIVGFGIPVLLLAKKITILMTVIIAFPISAFVQEQFTDIPAVLNWPLMFSTSFLLAFFFMITDPSTSPTRRWTQALYATSIVAVDQTLRALERPDSLMYAVFLVTALVPLARLVEEFALNRGFADTRLGRAFRG